MDYSYLDSIYNQQEDNFWDLISGDGDRTVNVQNKSDFKPYVKDMEVHKLSPEIPSSTVNVKRRMVDLLRKNWSEKINAAAPEKERCRRRMMKERTRREKQKQSYLALHSLLPIATKKDKNSIVQNGVDEIMKLQRLKKELERRLEMLEAKEHDDDMNGTKIKFNLQEPLSGLDSMLEVLQCLKSMGTKLISGHANFSNHEFSATMNIDTPIRGEEVEKRVERRLRETEWKLLFLPEASFMKD